MSLETGSRIQDLVVTNPVGATDFASQGDDHIRLIKACVQGSFPSLGATAVSLTGAQINDAALKGATQTIIGSWTFSAAPTMAGTNISALNASNLSTGTVPDARLSGNIPLKNAANTFTAQQTFSPGSGAPVIISPANNTYALSVTGLTTGYSGFTLGNTGGTAYLVLDGSAGAFFPGMSAYDCAFGHSATGTCLVAAGVAWVRLAPSGVTTFLGGLKAPLEPSTSTTLVKHQIHHITSAATLPALDNGEWVCVVNNSGSNIVITEHSGDTTYYTAVGASVSTVTVPARGRIFASGAGSSVVYVSGDVSAYT